MKQRKDGRWVRSVSVDGQRIYFYSTAKTERQAEKDITAQLLDYQVTLSRDKHNFKAIADRMLKSKKSTIEEATYECYKHSLKHLEPLYSYDIEDITPAIVQRLLDTMASLQGYSFSAVSKAKIIFSLILDYAIVHEELPLVNFARSLRVPKTATKGKVTAPPDDVIPIIIKNADSVPFGMWTMMLLCTGLRRGELAALRRKDINLTTMEITVTDAVDYSHNQAELKGKPKSLASADTIPIIDILQPHIITLCQGLSPEQFLFGGDNPLSKTQITKRLKQYCDNIGYSFTGHQLRHAFAKLVYEAGIDAKTAQRLLRHADFSTTMNIYTDFSKSMTKTAVEKLNNFTARI